MLIPPESKPRRGSLPTPQITTQCQTRPNGDGNYGSVVAEFRFPFSHEWAREHSDDPRVRCRWRLAREISQNFNTMAISFVSREHFQRRRRGVAPRTGRRRLRVFAFLCRTTLNAPAAVSMNSTT